MLCVKLEKDAHPTETPGRPLALGEGMTLRQRTSWASTPAAFARDARIVPAGTGGRSPAVIAQSLPTFLTGC